MSPSAQPVTVGVDGSGDVSGLLEVPHSARALLVLAHGAGAGMRHPFMSNVADALAERGVATLRYQFPYMEHGSKRPDAPRVAHAAVRGAITTARNLAPELALFAGGKSFGGRMTSQAQASAPLAGVRGLVFVSFPLHPAGKPSTERALHLANIEIPMLFVQGSRDELADLALLRPTVDKLGPRATLALIDEGDHSLHVPARTGRKDSDIMTELADRVATWMDIALGE
jgi:predicted alpha/beta-hydrolase family hydrolase